jgi:hypothetical protein
VGRSESIKGEKQMSTALAKQEEAKEVVLTLAKVDKMINFAVQRATAQLAMSFGSGTKRTMAELKEWGGLILEGDLIPKDKNYKGTEQEKKSLVARAIAKIVAGDQFGFDPISSQSIIHYIPTSGTLCLDYKGLEALILQSPKHGFRILEHTETRCIGNAIVNGQVMEPPIEYTLEDAKIAGLWSQDRADEKAMGTWPDGNPKIAKKGAWEAHPKDMLYSKFIRRVFNRYCSDLLITRIAIKEDLEEAESIEQPKQLPEPDFFTEIESVTSEQADTVTETSEQFTGPEVEPAEAVTVDEHGEVVDEFSGDPDDEGIRQDLIAGVNELLQDKFGDDKIGRAKFLASRNPQKMTAEDLSDTHETLLTL